MSCRMMNKSRYVPVRPFSHPSTTCPPPAPSRGRLGSLKKCALIFNVLVDIVFTLHLWGFERGFNLMPSNWSSFLFLSCLAIDVCALYGICNHDFRSLIPFGAYQLLHVMVKVFATIMAFLLTVYVVSHCEQVERNIHYSYDKDAEHNAPLRLLLALHPVVLSVVVTGLLSLWLIYSVDVFCSVRQAIFIMRSRRYRRPEDIEPLRLISSSVSMTSGPNLSPSPSTPPPPYSPA